MSPDPTLQTASAVTHTPWHSSEAETPATGAAGSGTWLVRTEMCYKHTLHFKEPHEK